MLQTKALPIGPLEAVAIALEIFLHFPHQQIGPIRMVLQAGGYIEHWEWNVAHAAVVFQCVDDIGVACVDW